MLFQCLGLTTTGRKSSAHTQVTGLIKRALVNITLASFALAGLVSCQTLDTKAPQESGVSADQTSIDAERDLPPAEQVNMALSALQTGDNENARRLLNHALRQKPNLRTAKYLMRQLDTDPVDYLGKENFAYRIKPGDTLSVLAARYLDSSLQFVILARYNGIQDPSQVHVGEWIKVPGKKPAPMLLPADETTTSDIQARQPLIDTEPKSESDLESDLASGPEPEMEATVVSPAPPEPEQVLTEEITPVEESDDVYLYAQNLYRAGRYSEAITVIEEALEQHETTSTLRALLLRDLLVRVYESYSEQLLNLGSISAARDILKKAVAMDPGNDKAVGQLMRVESELGSTP